MGVFSNYVNICGSDPKLKQKQWKSQKLPAKINVKDFVEFSLNGIQK